MASIKNDNLSEYAPLAKLETAGNELELLKLSTAADDDLIDASVHRYQYDPPLARITSEEIDADMPIHVERTSTNSRSPAYSLITFWRTLPPPLMSCPKSRPRSSPLMFRQNPFRNNH